MRGGGGVEEGLQEEAPAAGKEEDRPKQCLEEIEFACELIQSQLEQQ